MGQWIMRFAVGVAVAVMSGCGGVTTSSNSPQEDEYTLENFDGNFTRDDVTQIVTEHKTGLQWQDDEAAAETIKVWATSANVETGNYHDTSGDTATTYCNNLTLGGLDDWRLPSKNEMITVIDEAEAFEYIAQGYYWSSTDRPNHPEGAWYFYFGGDIPSDGLYKDNLVYVRCVRGEPL